MVNERKNWPEKKCENKNVVLDGYKWKVNNRVIQSKSQFAHSNIQNKWHTKEVVQSRKKKKRRTRKRESERIKKNKKWCARVRHMRYSSTRQLLYYTIQIIMIILRRLLQMAYVYLLVYNNICHFVLNQFKNPMWKTFENLLVHKTKDRRWNYYSKWLFGWSL